jgi:hypothetical protein
VVSEVFRSCGRNLSGRKFVGVEAKCGVDIKYVGARSVSRLTIMAVHISRI